MKYRKKPIVIEAIQWNGRNIEEVLQFMRPDELPSDGINAVRGVGHTPMTGDLDIPTLEGVMTAKPGDWIIRGVKGEYYPCKPDIFEATYEKAE